MSIEEKVKVYAERWKEYDPRIVDGIALCYKYSPLYQKFINSPHIGKVFGWRITYAWSYNPKKYPMLKWVGPLDLGLFAVRIDGILGRTDIREFVSEARDKPIFNKYIIASAEFALSLIANNELGWIYSELNDVTRESIKRAVKAISRYSPTLREVLKSGKNDGWEIVSLWVDDPYEIKTLHRIYPLDVAIYSARLDSIIYKIDLTPMATNTDVQLSIKLFATEIARFLADILDKWWLCRC